jgi:hypothetical protein
MFDAAQNGVVVLNHVVNRERANPEAIRFDKFRNLELAW